MHVRAESNWVSLSITYPLRVCLFALLYYFSLRISLSFALINEFVTLFNIAAGIGLALLLRFGIRYWPAILLGACFGFYQINPDIGLALILAAGQTLQALVGVWVLSRLFTLNSSFERIQDVILLMIAGAVLVTFVYPSVAVIGLFINGAITLNEFRFVWFNAWLGEITGVMIFASVLLVWADRIRWEYNWLRYLEAGFFIYSVYFVWCRGLFWLVRHQYCRLFTLSNRIYFFSATCLGGFQTWPAWGDGGCGGTVLLCVMGLNA